MELYRDRALYRPRRSQGLFTNLGSSCVMAGLANYVCLGDTQKMFPAALRTGQRS